MPPARPNGIRLAPQSGAGTTDPSPEGRPVYRRAMLSLDELRAEVETGAIDTVDRRLHGHAGPADGQAARRGVLPRRARRRARARGLQLPARARHGDGPGARATRWRAGSSGYGDFDLQPDLATLRRIPWHEATALVLCDVAWHDGTPVAPSPRQVLRRRSSGRAALGFEPMFGSELEFYLFSESYEEAHAKHFRDLTPSVPYILDYHILATSYDEPFLREVRNGDAGRRDPGRELEGRGVAGPARDQLPLRRRADGWPTTT